LARRLGGPQSRSGLDGEEKNSQKVFQNRVLEDFREIGWGILGWIHLAQDRVQCPTFVNTAVNVPSKARNILTS
jgi:hypothetical protein